MLKKKIISNFLYNWILDSKLKYKIKKKITKVLVKKFAIRFKSIITRIMVKKKSEIEKKNWIILEILICVHFYLTIIKIYDSRLVLTNAVFKK